MLNDLNKLMRKMQNESEKYSSRQSAKLVSSSKQFAKSSSSVLETSLVYEVSKSSSDLASKQKAILVERYSSEVATVSKLKEYDDVARKQKETLLKENQSLKVKFSQEVLEARQLEKTIVTVSHMISEFIQILHSQSESVQDIHGAGKDATAHVNQVNDELMLTIQRTQSHSSTMILIILSLTVMLIILDYLTP